MLEAFSGSFLMKHSLYLFLKKPVCLLNVSSIFHCYNLVIKADSNSVCSLTASALVQAKGVIADPPQGWLVAVFS